MFFPTRKELYTAAELVGVAFVLRFFVLNGTLCSVAYTKTTHNTTEIVPSTVLTTFYTPNVTYKMCVCVFVLKDALCAAHISFAHRFPAERIAPSSSCYTKNLL